MSYLDSLEMGLSFDLQSAGDSFSDAIERKEIKPHFRASLTVQSHFLLLLCCKQISHSPHHCDNVLSFQQQCSWRALNIKTRGTKSSFIQKNWKRPVL